VLLRISANNARFGTAQFVGTTLHQQVPQQIRIGKNQGTMLCLLFLVPRFPTNYGIIIYKKLKRNTILSPDRNLFGLLKRPEPPAVWTMQSDGGGVIMQGPANATLSRSWRFNASTPFRIYMYTKGLFRVLRAAQGFSTACR
jgi:hypothetical protein